MSNDPTKYRLGSGTVQSIVKRDTPWFMYHFGRAAYDRNVPVLSDSIREQAQPIVNALNSGEITEDEARWLLDRIYF